MKITLNKEYTLASQVPSVKEKMKYFKAIFTDGDLLKMFCETTDANIDGRIVECSVEAFASNEYTNDASFLVSMIVDRFIEFRRIRFYIDEDENTYRVNEDPILLSDERYRFA